MRFNIFLYFVFLLEWMIPVADRTYHRWIDVQTVPQVMQIWFPNQSVGLSCLWKRLFVSEPVVAEVTAGLALQANGNLVFTLELRGDVEGGDEAAAV